MEPEVLKPRIELAHHSAAYTAMLGLEQYARQSGVETPLLELVRLRASLLNGCAYCIDMHTKDARAAGETEQRLYALSAWRETPFYTPRERAALDWTEAVTEIGASHAPERSSSNGSAPISRKPNWSATQHGYRRHQRLEPFGHRFSYRSWNVSGQEVIIHQRSNTTT